MASRLHQAIRGNSVEVVRECLETGTSPNVSPSLASLSEVKQVDEEDDSVSIPKEHWLVRTHDTCRIAPVHMAIMNCYHNHGPHENEYHSDAPRARSARSILQLLIEHGADMECAVEDLCVCNIEGYKWHHVDAGSKPIDLVIFLKQHTSGFSNHQGAFLDEIVRILQAAAKASGHAKPRTVPVPKSALSTWQTLLGSDKFADVHFRCTDGEVLHAHKAVLAAASEYFATLFGGPWADNHADGTLPTSNSAEVMRAVLSYVYTGVLDRKLLEAHATALVGLGAEYRLVELRRLAEQACIRSLAVENVKDVLQLAHLHEAADLKSACFTFVQRHAATVLTNPAVMRLASEAPELWAELAATINAGSQTQAPAGGKKRART